MVRAAISADGKSDIIRFDGNVTARRYQNEVLELGLLPFINRHNNQMIFMQDNAPAHRALATSDWLLANYFQVFGPLLSKSSDKTL